MSIRYLSVCSGIESASVAWHPLGWQAAGFAEIESFPSKVLAHHYGSNLPGEPLSQNGVPNYGDFTAIPLERLGPVDLLVGGTPCQAFSVAGKRLSLADARGNLSLAYTVLAHELARSHGLQWAVWENVPGVLSTDDNAFGCFLGALVGADDPLPLPSGTGRWPDVGMVAGPRARAAWRILDAQYFGLAQRRRRVFVVAGFGDGPDPAEILFECQGVRWHPPSRGKAGQGVASPIAAGSPSGSGYRNDADTAENLIAHALRAQENLSHRADQDTLVPVAYGGNRTSGPVDVAAALGAHDGPHGRQDFATETFVVTHALRGDGFDASEDGTGRGPPIVPICFDARQSDALVYGNVTGPLDTKFPVPAIAFAPEIAASLTRGAESHGRGSYAGRRQEDDTNLVATSWAVRRLMPVETERLQGFPDNYTNIPGAADGPRYKTHGNSMAVSVMAWIGRRIAAAESIERLEAAE